MAKLRLEITKGEEIRYISHLDYAGAIEQAVIRAKLPVGYSEGFNPHMKLAFASALAVGVTSQAEYMDIELKEQVELKEAIERLMASLPQGIRIKAGTYVHEKSPALMAIVNLATYDVIVPLSTENSEIVAESIMRFNEAQTVLYTRETPKGNKEIEVKQYIAEPITAVKQENLLKLVINISITPTGSIKPGEVLAALVNIFALPVLKDSALINRTGLYITDEKTKTMKTPIDL